MLHNFGWILPGRLAGMGYPDPDAAPALRAAGVGAVLSLTEHAPWGDGLAEGLTVRHEPVRDFTPPTPEALDRCVAFVRARWAAGDAVVVHCMAGLGRTGTVLAALLVAEGADPDEALATVRRRRPGSVETAAQEACVRGYAARRVRPTGPGGTPT